VYARSASRWFAVGHLLATHAIKTSDAPFALRAVRLLDLAVLALALPVFLAADWPLFGWAGVTVVWLTQRSVQALIEKRARSTTNPRTMVGLLSISLMGRIWFLMFAVLAIGLIDRDSGLPAAVLTAVTFQAWFTGFMVSRGMEESA
jgi:hypothetical protein